VAGHLPVSGWGTLTRDGTGYAPPCGGWGAVSNSSCGPAGSSGLMISYSDRVRRRTRGESGRLPWGNSLTMKSIKFQSINVLGAIVDWS
jgi:hypothetical protein